MKSEPNDHRKAALLLLLPIFAVGMFAAAAIVSGHPMDPGPAVVGFSAGGILLLLFYFMVQRHDELITAISSATIALVTIAIIGRIFQLNLAMSGEYSGGLVSVFLGIYAYIPCLYLLAFSLLQRGQALYFSLATWAALAAIVFYFNADQLSQEVWREGFEHVLLVVVFCQPLFIALIYRVPPYAAALVFAQQEASRARAALGNMSQLASVDPLTNLYNRRFLKEYWDDFGNPDRDCQVHLSMFILDIDYFKQFNDTSGHLAGDSCLQKIAGEICHLSALHNGHAIRYGGEEFLILIPSSSPESTANLAELFRRAVAELKIQHPSEDFDYVTVSVGATHGTNVDSNSEATWIRAADSALYAAKRAGRNCSKLHSLAT